MSSLLGKGIRFLFTPIRRFIEHRAPAQWKRTDEAMEMRVDPVGQGTEYAEDVLNAPWQKMLTSMLRARGRSDKVPSDLESALEMAGREFHDEGKRLVQASLVELLDQIEVARSSDSENLLNDRLARLAERMEGLRKEWLHELEKAATTESAPRRRDPAHPAVQSRINQDLAAFAGAVVGLPREVPLPADLIMWSSFAGAEVALGALAEISQGGQDRSSKA